MCVVFLKINKNTKLLLRKDVVLNLAFYLGKRNSKGKCVVI